MTPRELARRVRELEGAAGAPLSGLERRELAELEREYQARFPGEVETWSQEQCDEFIAYSTGRDGLAARLGELRRRALSPGEQAQHRATAIAIESMDAAALDLWFAEMVRAAQEEIRP